MARTDNASAHQSAEYDVQISATIPYFAAFYQSTLDLIAAWGQPVTNWLDTGCGTGSLAVLARSRFGQTEFILADPATTMLDKAREKMLGWPGVHFVQAGSQELTFADGSFDVITAIQCHHYLDKSGRLAATKNCWRMLKTGGIYVEFENIRLRSSRGQAIGLAMWQNYQLESGKTPTAAAEHIQRFDREYFPITILEHLDLLQSSGFDPVEILWVSYLQAGFYAIKSPLDGSINRPVLAAPAAGSALQ